MSRLVRSALVDFLKMGVYGLENLYVFCSLFFAEMSGKPELLYFDITGRGEIIRLLYKHAGVEFEDKRISFAEWPEYKSNRKILLFLYTNKARLPKNLVKLI